MPCQARRPLDSYLGRFNSLRTGGWDRSIGGQEKAPPIFFDGRGRVGRKATQPPHSRLRQRPRLVVGAQRSISHPNCLQPPNDMKKRRGRTGPSLAEDSSRLIHKRSWESIGLHACMLLARFVGKGSRCWSRPDTHDTTRALNQPHTQGRRLIDRGDPSINPSGPSRTDPRPDPRAQPSE